jgi:class 3 adenylate cyclase
VTRIGPVFGASLTEVTVLFADLQGFTGFCERVPPGKIIEMLNRYHAATVPCILRNGGTVVQFVGDALLAIFASSAGKREDALRAARAGLAMRDAAEGIAALYPGYPQLRIGINTGLAVLGDVGSPELRAFNAMGDAVNVAARLQSRAAPGTVVIGAATREWLGSEAAVDRLGELTLKGRNQPVRAFVLRSVAGHQPMGTRLTWS